MRITQSHRNIAEIAGFELVEESCGFVLCVDLCSGAEDAILFDNEGELREHMISRAKCSAALERKIKEKNKRSEDQLEKTIREYLNAK
jgi:hypothetical protein